MTEQVGTFWLKDRRTGQEVEATLWRTIDDRHVEDYAQKWKPVFEARMAELRRQGDLTLDVVGDHNLQDSHWEWARKVEQRRNGLAWESFALEAEDVTQGLMFVRMDAFAREPAQRNKPIVDIDLIATAPWNRFRLVPEPQFKAVGLVLFGAAISLSVEEEFGGRIGLHALPQAESWYCDVCGMTDLGVDGTGMRYFEMTEAQAKAFVS